jgi:hypothetical protein
MTRPTQKKKEVIRMRKILMLVVALGWFGQWGVCELMPDWAWPVWGRGGFENIISRIKIFGENVV